MAISFKLNRNYIHDVDVVEVRFGDKLIATICPPPPADNSAALTVVSKHIKKEKIVIDDSDDTEPTVVLVPFDIG